MISEVIEVAEVNYLEVTDELIIYVVVPENGYLHDFLVKSSFFYLRPQVTSEVKMEVGEVLKLLPLPPGRCTESLN